VSQSPPARALEIEKDRAPKPAGVDPVLGTDDAAADLVPALVGVVGTALGAVVPPRATCAFDGPQPPMIDTVTTRIANGRPRIARC
jgi:hypothetical protein